MPDNLYIQLLIRSELFSLSKLGVYPIVELLMYPTKYQILWILQRDVRLIHHKCWLGTHYVWRCGMSHGYGHYYMIANNVFWVKILVEELQALIQEVCIWSNQEKLLCQRHNKYDHLMFRPLATSTMSFYFHEIFHFPLIQRNQVQWNPVNATTVGP